MDSTLATATLGALFAATVGYIFTRIFLTNSHSVLVLTWLASFCADFVLLLMLSRVPGYNFHRWMMSSCLLSLYFIGWYLGYGKDLPMSDYDERWQFGAASIIISIGAGLVVKEKWWMGFVSQAFPDEAFISVFGVASVLIFGGFFLYFHGRNIGRNI